MGWTGPIEVTEDPAHPFAHRLADLDLTVPFKINGQRFRDQLGFSDVVDLEVGLEKTIEEEKSQLSRSELRPDRQGVGACAKGNAV